ncbi:MAG: hypothetical protein PHY80_05260 [Rickettsiales bacterium]|nr:hypothetical protein [Rickettsiales bacterium]
MTRGQLEALLLEFDYKLSEIVKKLGYDPLKYSGYEDEELVFDFAYYRGQKDLVSDMLKNDKIS